MSFFDYEEEKQIKNSKGEIQYFKQIIPFTCEKIFEDIVSMRFFGNNVAFYSKTTRNCLGISNIITKKLFEEV